MDHGRQATRERKSAGRSGQSAEKFISVQKIAAGFVFISIFDKDILPSGEA
jgi:hypothetical protein